MATSAAAASWVQQQQQQQKALSDALYNTEWFFQKLGINENIPEASESKDFYHTLIRSLLKVDRIERGRVACSLLVTSASTLRTNSWLPILLNPYNTLHGGAVAAVAEAVGLACAKTVAGDKELFLGESSTAYLAAARLNEVVEVDSSVLRQGRSVVVTTTEFRLKKTQKLLYTSRATFYVTPVASL